MSNLKRADGYKTFETEHLGITYQFINITVSKICLSSCDHMQDTLWVIIFISRNYMYIEVAIRLLMII